MQEFSSGLLNHMVWNHNEFLLNDRVKATQLMKKKGKVNSSWTKGVKQTFASVEVLVNLCLKKGSHDELFTSLTGKVM
jgi:hypothetical protein